MPIRRLDSYLRILRVLALLVFGSGCLMTPGSEILRPAFLKDKPQFTVFKDPTADFSRYKTFSVFPNRSEDGSATMNPILEKQLSYALRNRFEAWGYRYVGLDENPDLMVTGFISSDYHETYIQPSSTTVPKWVPGRTINVQANTSGKVQVFGAGGTKSGTYSGTTSTQAHVPGYMTTETRTDPGYTIGSYYPAAAIAAYDGKSHENVWLGYGVGISEQPDVRISSQFVLDWLMTELPYGNNHPPAQGWLGVELRQYTIDGNNFFPVFYTVYPDTPAAKAGLLDGAFVVAINGRSTQNLTYSGIREFIDGPPGSQPRFDVLRYGKVWQYTVTLGNRPPEPAR